MFWLSGFFFVHAFPAAGLGDPNTVISTPCGAELAVNNVQGAIFNMVTQSAGCSAAGCTYVLPLPSAAAYYIGVTAVCGAHADPRAPGSAPCMPANQEGQRVAWPAVQDSPFAPSPAVSPTPSPSPTPGAAPAAPAKSSPAGAVVGTLFALAAVGALGWFGVERFYPGGRAAFYQPVMNLLPSGMGGGGGSGGYRATGSADRGAVGAHPIFSSGGGESLSS
jgi:hypothetical protein